MVALRTTIPDWVSMVVGNTIVLIGPVVLYLGLLRFCSKKASSLLISFIVAVLATFVRGGRLAVLRPLIISELPTALVLDHYLDDVGVSDGLFRETFSGHNLHESYYFVATVWYKRRVPFYGKSVLAVI